MKVMKLPDQSAGAMTWLAALILVPGLLIGSPSGRFFCVALAGVVALMPLMFGAGKRRVFAGIVAAISLLFGIATYPEFSKDQDTYRERVRQKNLPPPAPTLALPPGSTR